MANRGRTLLCALGVAVAAVILAAPAVASATVARASGGAPTLDLCVVLPGFDTPGAAFTLHSTGPKNFDESGQLSASACGSYTQVPKGQYTVTQSATPSGFHLAQIYCFQSGAADHATGAVDLSSDSVSVKVSQPTECLFAELTGGGGGSSGGGSSGFSPGGSSSTTTTTTKGTTTTGGGTVKSFCALHPTLCTHFPVQEAPAQP
ncbi:MAG TPA: hypothetical protein VN180_06430 [Acidimicrobiia bacterium]|jgi:uncharacterized membrane protein YgcG|nr:hypothetical protein [Acidimicrobiia bacterium]HWW44692.1 hypothetical protein [Acidimicrobiia bacterium]